MKNLSNQVDTLNNMVFEKRNKEYGAYVIRAEYNMNKIKSTLITDGCFFTLVFGLWFFSGGKQVIEENFEIPEQIVKWVEVNLEKEPKQPENKPKTASAAMAGATIGKISLTAEDHAVKDNSNLDKPVDGKLDNPDANGTSKTDSVIATTIIEDVQPVKQTTTVFQYADVMPGYNGNMGAFLQSQIVYPESAIYNGTEGTVYAQFVVDQNGAISNVKAVKGIGDGCDEEAIRVVKKMPTWKPETINGSPVSVIFNLPIKFKLR